MSSLLGLKVRVYYNTHKKCLSVQHKGKVISHVKDICLENVEFKVSDAGRLRAIKEGKKNVHAFVVGTVVPKTSKVLNIPVTYNPYQYTQFVYKATGKGISRAKECRIKGGDVYVQ
jgi:hypothetical protein